MPPDFAGQLAPLPIKLHGQLALLGYPSVADDLPKPSCVLGPERPRSLNHPIRRSGFFVMLITQIRKLVSDLPPIAPITVIPSN